jgi:hypothetical protein
MPAPVPEAGTLSATAQREIVESWEQLSKRLTDFSPGWAYRGMSHAGWRLQTSLERLRLVPVREAERYLLQAFQRRAHHYLTDLPASDGAPTRLLDWTKSPFVAAFFALEGATDADGYCAVWAVYLPWCKREAIQKLDPTGGLSPDESLGRPPVFRERFLPSPNLPAMPVPLVAPVQPFRMNPRLTIQQGLFLCPGDVALSFEDNLLALGPPHVVVSGVTQIVIASSVRVRALAVLNRMNINRATLFPGLDGFAQSLSANVQIATDEGTLRRELQQLSIYTEWGFL